MKKTVFSFLSLLAVTLLVGFDKAQGSDDMVLALDRSTVMKLIGFVIVAMLAEIWRNQRALFKITTGMGKEIEAVKGFCAGKNGECGARDVHRDGRGG